MTNIFHLGDQKLFLNDKTFKESKNCQLNMPCMFPPTVSLINVKPCVSEPTAALAQNSPQTVESSCTSRVLMDSFTFQNGSQEVTELTKAVSLEVSSLSRSYLNLFQFTCIFTLPHFLFLFFLHCIFFYHFHILKKFSTMFWWTLLKSVCSAG